MAKPKEASTEAEYIWILNDSAQIYSLGFNQSQKNAMGVTSIVSSRVPLMPGLNICETSVIVRCVGQDLTELGRITNCQVEVVDHPARMSGNVKRKLATRTSNSAALEAWLAYEQDPKVQEVLREQLALRAKKRGAA